MSMELITLEQLVGIFLAYLCISIVFPHFVLGKTLHLKNRFEKFMIYTVFGNFYAINLVYYLQILHISNRFTLILFTAVPCLIIKVILEDIPVYQILRGYWETLRRLAGGQLGLKAYRQSRKPIREARRARILDHFKQVYVIHVADFILVTVFLACLVWIFGLDMFRNFGYKASDIVVHNYWINSMNDNKIFITGVYPYGMHCMIYYIHTVFGIDTTSLLRLFAFVQTVWVYSMLLCFLKCISKNHYIPYVGAFTYVLADFYRYSTYSRFAATLPQEFGIIFILPSIYALFMFFREQERYERGKRNNSIKVYLIAFAMSVSLTFTVHFYGMAAVGLYCIAIAIAFIRLFIKKQYFSKIMLTGITSIVIAILPMVIAVILGAQLQGSLYWGLSVMRGEDTSGEQTTETTVEEDTDTEREQFIEEYGTAVGTVVYGADKAAKNMGSNVLSFENEDYVYFTWLAPILLLMVSIIVLLLTRKKDPMYGPILVSTAIFSFFMMLMLNAGIFHLPVIMDMNRGGIYYSYVSTIGLTLIIDAALYIVSYRFKQKWVFNLTTFICISALLVYIFTHGGYRKPVESGVEEMNEAVICLTNIIRDEQPKMWTIVSANDERQMANDRGFHYEIIEFLNRMENFNSFSRVTIPTPTVYFFVEKVLFQQTSGGIQRDKTISSQMASEKLPSSNGLSAYQNDNRLIVMSKMYEWCEAFRKLYPNEVTIYKESDDFVCYRVEQNPYRLFNFAFDYGYNTKEYPQLPVEDQEEE